MTVQRGHGIVWAFDVDGTLIGSIRSGVLRPGAAELLAMLAARGVRCVLWSAGGDDYARQMAERHCIADAFVGFYAKDRRDHEGHYSVDHFLAEHLPTAFVDDSPTDLLADAHIVAVSQFIGNNAADRALHGVLDHLDVHLAACRGRRATEPMSAGAEGP